MSHVILTGPIRGTVTTEDGTTVDLNSQFVEVDDAQAAEVAHLIGLRYAAEGHPDDPPGEPFVYDAPAEFADYVPNPENPDTITSSTKEA